MMNISSGKVNYVAWDHKHNDQGTYIIHHITIKISIFLPYNYLWKIHRKPFDRRQNAEELKKTSV